MGNFYWFFDAFQEVSAKIKGKKDYIHWIFVIIHKLLISLIPTTYS